MAWPTAWSTTKIWTMSTIICKFQTEKAIGSRANWSTLRISDKQLLLLFSLFNRSYAMTLVKDEMRLVSRDQCEKISNIYHVHSQKKDFGSVPDCIGKKKKRKNGKTRKPYMGIYRGINTKCRKTELYRINMERHQTKSLRGLHWAIDPEYHGGELGVLI